MIVYRFFTLCVVCASLAVASLLMNLHRPAEFVVSVFALSFCLIPILSISIFFTIRRVRDRRQAGRAAQTVAQPGRLSGGAAGGAIRRKGEPVWPSSNASR